VSRILEDSETGICMLWVSQLAQTTKHIK